MEQQEEKKMKVYRRQYSMAKSNSSIPIDIVSEILLKLPAKSIVRFRCVSKLWSSITTDQYFISSFQTRSSPKPSLLIFFKATDKLVVFSSPQSHQNTNNESYSSQHVDLYEMKCPKDLCSISTESVHGLIYFQNSGTIIIWNPTMRRFLTLPRPEYKGIVLLGYDPIEQKHKVVFMAPNGCWVLTLGSSSAQEPSSWRMIETNLYHRPFNCINKHWRCINGVLYFLAMHQHWVLMSFDVRSETFQQIRLPLGYITTELMIAYRGRLAFVHSNNNEQGIKLWYLEDAEKEKWVEKSFDHIDQSLKTIFKISGAIEDGELIFVPSMFLKPFFILYFDPKRNSFRKVELEGIADELGYSRFAFHAFPNHIDSLISL